MEIQIPGGDNPNSDERFSADVRWPGVLQNLLKDEYDVVNEGLCGRTFKAIETGKEHRSGINHLQSILNTSDPIDTIVIMLGTNDLKDTFKLSSEEISNHLEETVEFIRNDEYAGKANIIIISPAYVVHPVGREVDERMKNAPERSRELPKLYEKVASKHKCKFINAGDLFTLESTDGYHLDTEHHKILGEKVFEVIE